MAGADAALGHLIAWSSLSDEVKQARLDGAALWLRASYRAGSGGPLPRVATGDMLDRLREAEYFAAVYALDHELFRETETTARGALIKERRKVDVLETEYQYAEPASGAFDGPVRLYEVDAILLGVAVLAGEVPASTRMFVA